MCVPKEEQFGLQKIGGLEQSYNEAHFFLVTNRLVGFGVVMIYKFITGFVVIFESPWVFLYALQRQILLAAGFL